jgi:hypothetical protein
VGGRVRVDRKKPPTGHGARYAMGTMEAPGDGDGRAAANHCRDLLYYLFTPTAYIINNIHVDSLIVIHIKIGLIIAIVVYTNLVFAE